MSKISVILPLYRTAPYLRELHDRLTKTLAGLGDEYELLMIDDGSPDVSWEIVRELAASDHRVKAVRLSRNFGQHPAIAAALEHASGDRVVLMDADLQDRPEDIPLILDRLGGEIHIVYTTKHGEPESFGVRLTSRFYHAMIARVLRLNVPRDVGTFRAFTRTFLTALRSYPEYNALFGPLMFYVGFQHGVVAVRRDRRQGRSSYSFRKRLALAVNSLVSYTDLPQRILVGAGGLVLMGSTIYGLLILGMYLFAPAVAPPGLNLIIFMLTALLGTTMFSLGIIGTYVFRIYQEVLRRPRYVVAERLNFASALEGERT